MRKSKLNKILAMAMLSFSIALINVNGVQAAWRQDSKGWWYEQGNSYLKNCWQLINGNWYYFDNDGYMESNAVVNGYYLNGNGCWADAPAEVQAYIDLSKNLRKLKNEYNFNVADYFFNGSNSYYSFDLIDLDGNGVYEAVWYNETSHADAKTSVLTYKNGKVELAGELGNTVEFDEKQKVLIGSYMNGGVQAGGVYKLVTG